MRYDEISLKVREIVANLFERDAATLSDDTLLMQDLPCESIDLLEVSVQLGATFHIFVDEERAFLRSLRYQLAGAPDAAAFLREHYGHLDEARRQQLAAYYTDADGTVVGSVQRNVVLGSSSAVRAAAQRWAMIWTAWPAACARAVMPSGPPARWKGFPSARRKTGARTGPGSSSKAGGIAIT